VRRRGSGTGNSWDRSVRRVKKVKERLVIGYESDAFLEDSRR
jgi:hypothetical protein